MTGLPGLFSFIFGWFFGAVDVQSLYFALQDLRTSVRLQPSLLRASFFTLG